MSRPFPQTRDYDTGGLDACPHCGSNEGFCYAYGEARTQYFTWDGVAVGASEGYPLFTRKMRCVSCNKIVEKYIKPIMIKGILVSES